MKSGIREVEILHTDTAEDVAEGGPMTAGENKAEDIIEVIEINPDVKTVIDDFIGTNNVKIKIENSEFQCDICLKVLSSKNNLKEN